MCVSLNFFWYECSWHESGLSVPLQSLRRNRYHSGAPGAPAPSASLRTWSGWHWGRPWLWPWCLCGTASGHCLRSSGLPLEPPLTLAAFADQGRCTHWVGRGGQWISTSCFPTNKIHVFTHIHFLLFCLKKTEHIQVSSCKAKQLVFRVMSAQQQHFGN